MNLVPIARQWQLHSICIPDMLDSVSVSAPCRGDCFPGMVDSVMTWMDAHTLDSPWAALSARDGTARAWVGEEPATNGAARDCKSEQGAAGAGTATIGAAPNGPARDAAASDGSAVA